MKRIYLFAKQDDEMAAPPATSVRQSRFGLLSVGCGLLARQHGIS